MNDITRTLIGYTIILTPIIIIGLLIFFKIKKIIRKNKMTPEERKQLEEIEMIKSKKGFYEIITMLAIIIIIIIIAKLMIKGYYITTIF